ncbi:MAG: hypothetical protein WCK77_23935 [Verrucomicrobiota bacterium]
MKDTALDPTTATATPSAPLTEHATSSTTPTERAADYAIYKPNSRGNGGVLRFSLNPAKAALFVEAAAQCGDKQFDWDNKIIMKWGLSDVGSVLATLQARQPQAKLFHQTDKANSAFDLTLRDDPERAPYALSISRQDTADKSLRKVAIPLTHAEAAVLEAALRVAVGRLIGW